MNGRLTDVLAALLFAGILTCWAPGYWPVALVETGAFALLAWVLMTRPRIPAGFAGGLTAGMLACSLCGAFAPPWIHCGASECP
jgi:hypothetical protein